MSQLCVNWYISLWYPFYFICGSVECHCNDIEETFHISERKAFRLVEEGTGCFCKSFLLNHIHIVLWGSLDAFLAGLDLHKMYTFGIERYDVYLKMSAPVVPFQYRMTFALQKT